MAPFLGMGGFHDPWGYVWRLRTLYVAYQTPETLNSPEGTSPSENKTLALKAVQASPQT